MNRIKYEHIDYVKKPVSRIIMGTAIPAMLSGEGDDNLLDAALDAGINTIDTARVYGESERLLGEWMQKRGNRDALVLISKCAHFDQATGRKRVTPEDIKQDMLTSLSLLQCKHIDIYLLHRDDHDVDVAPIVEVLNELKSDGKISAFGGSNWTHERLQEANEYAYKKNLQPFSISSPNFGLATQQGDPWGGGSVSISGEKNMAARNWYRDCSMPIIAYSSLGRGMFSGKVKSDDPGSAAKFLDDIAYKSYVSEENFKKLKRVEDLAEKKNCTVSQIAIAWLFNQPFPTFCVLGTTNKERFFKTADALYISLTSDELDYLDLVR